MTADEKADRVGEFLDHYTASETPATVDRYLAGLRTLSGRPRSEQIQEQPL